MKGCYSLCSCTAFRDPFPAIGREKQGVGGFSRSGRRASMFCRMFPRNGFFTAIRGASEFLCKRPRASAALYLPFFRGFLCERRAPWARGPLPPTPSPGGEGEHRCGDAAPMPKNRRNSNVLPPPLGGGAGGGVSLGRVRRRPFWLCLTFAEESSEEGEVGERSEPGGGGASPIPIAGRASPQGESSGGPKRPHRPRCARPLPPLKRGKDILRRPCRFAEDSIRGRWGDRRSGSDGKDARGALGTHFGR